MNIFGQRALIYALQRIRKLATTGYQTGEKLAKAGEIADKVLQKLK